METEVARSGPPIFLVGVPRSGTTLLRVLLGQHPDLTAGPECPWLCGSYGAIPSVKGLLEQWSTHTLGPVAGGVPMAKLEGALARLVDELLGAPNKRWVEKTPNHIREVPTLHRLFPHAQYIHLVRDGRDVACSTRNQRNGKFWGGFLEHEGERLPNNRLMALLRWVRWNQQFEHARERFGLRTLTVHYESLVRFPNVTLRKICDFLRLPFAPELLHYPDAFPTQAWEAGAADVARWQEMGHTEIGKWQTQMSAWEKWAGAAFANAALKQYGYLSPAPLLAAPCAREYC